MLTLDAVGREAGAFSLASVAALVDVGVAVDVSRIAPLLSKGVPFRDPAWPVVITHSLLRLCHSCLRIDAEHPVMLGCDC